MVSLAGTRALAATERQWITGALGELAQLGWRSGATLVRSHAVEPAAAGSRPQSRSCKTGVAIARLEAAVEFEQQ